MKVLLGKMYRDSPAKRVKTGINNWVSLLPSHGLEFLKKSCSQTVSSINLSILVFLEQCLGTLFFLRCYIYTMMPFLG
jgi:hypothetical protein